MVAPGYFYILGDPLKANVRDNSLPSPHPPPPDQLCTILSCQPLGASFVVVVVELKKAARI